jgi:GNAT superfamily N-acetyltransferase
MSREIHIQPAIESPALRQFCQVVNAVSPEQRMHTADLAHYLASNQGSVLLLAHAGVDVAGAATAAPAGRPGFQFTMVRVVPGQRRQGVGSVLLKRLMSMPDLALPRVWGRIDAGDQSRSSSRGAGAVEAGRERYPPSTRRRSRRFRSEGYRRQPGRPPDLIVGAYEAERECLPDVPVPTPMEATTFDVWLEQTLGGPGALPDGSMVALAGDEVIGFAGLRGDAAGSGTAEHLLTCVRRPWRGRGVAAAMKSAQIAGRARRPHELKRRTSPNAMLAVNRQLGYRMIAECGGQGRRMRANRREEPSR